MAPLIRTFFLAVGLVSAEIPLPQRVSAPDLTAIDARGHRLTLSSLKGRVVLLDFWATTCGGCKTEIPWYVDFDKRYRAQGLTVLGVSMDDDGMRVVKPFLAANHMAYPVVLGNDAIAAQYHLSALPMTLLLDRQGRIAYSFTGIIDKSNFEARLISLLH